MSEYDPQNYEIESDIDVLTIVGLIRLPTTTVEQCETLLKAALKVAFGNGVIYANNKRIAALSGEGQP